MLYIISIISLLRSENVCFVLKMGLSLLVSWSSRSWSGHPSNVITSSPAPSLSSLTQLRQLSTSALLSSPFPSSIHHADSPLAQGTKHQYGTHNPHPEARDLHGPGVSRRLLRLHAQRPLRGHAPDRPDLQPPSLRQIQPIQEPDYARPLYPPRSTFRDQSVTAREERETR